MESKDIRVTLAGDPLLDVYYDGELQPISMQGNRQYRRLTTDSITSIQGGSLNVLQNLKALVSNSNIQVEDSMQGVKPIKLSRVRSSAKGWIEFYNSATPNNAYADVDLFKNISFCTNKKEVLVLSDYNKGMLQKNPNYPSWYKPELIIADSRYKSLNLEFLKARPSATTIWHATGSEYDWEWAQNFDWIVWTNGPGQVWLGTAATYENDSTGWIALQVPDTKVVDVTGAGDTFTAALAAYLCKYGSDINRKKLKEAAKFAIECCQEVIQQKYCAITTKRIS